jgi:predicted Zn finger-like uncharacterized protein
MEVRCDKCQARYRVDDARIGPQGLTMRCGKCQNTFRVTRPAPPVQQISPPPPKPVAAARSPDMNATAIFAVPPAARPSAPAKPPPQTAKTAAAISPAPPASEEAGRTMMFPAASLPGGGVAVSKGPQAGASGTATFGQPRVAKVAPAPPSVSNPPAVGQSTVSGKRSTLVFGPPQPQARSAPTAAPMPIAAPVPTPVPTPEPPGGAPPPAEAVAQPAAAALEHTTTPDLIAAGASAVPAAPPAEEHEVADEEPTSEPGTFDRAPPRGLIIGVAAGLALLLVVGAGLVAYRKLAPRAPPPAAIETLASAQADADKDSLPSIASAETKARDALEVAGLRVRFPQATATLARIEIQWADALNDQAGRIAEKNADDPRVAQLQTQAKARVKSAFDMLSPAMKANADSQELQLAFADYYRAKRLPSSMNRYLKDVKDESRAALIQGLALAQEDDGAEKAVPKLKAALAANPQSARIHYRLGVVHLALKEEANARAELKEALRLSPQHERAQALLDQLGGAADRK